jgi:hypothetical protein
MWDYSIGVELEICEHGNNGCAVLHSRCFGLVNDHLSLGLDVALADLQYALLALRSDGMR